MTEAAEWPWPGIVICTEAGEVLRLVRFGKPIEPFRIDNPDGNKGYRLVRLPLPGTRDWRTYGAHRLVWQFFNGPIPLGAEIDHINEVKDDNRLVNLRPLTAAQNIQASYANGRKRLWSSTVKKCSPEEARAARASGLVFREIGELYGISITHAQRLCSGGN